MIGARSFEPKAFINASINTRSPSFPFPMRQINTRRRLTTLRSQSSAGNLLLRRASLKSLLRTYSYAHDSASHDPARMRTRVNGVLQERCELDPFGPATNLRLLHNTKEYKATKQDSGRQAARARGHSSPRHCVEWQWTDEKSWAPCS